MTQANFGGGMHNRQGPMVSGELWLIDHTASRVHQMSSHLQATLRRGKNSDMTCLQPLGWRFTAAKEWTNVNGAICNKHQLS